MKTTQPTENPADVLIELHHGDNTKALKISEMVQRHHYDDLRRQITTYIDSVDIVRWGSQPPSGSGWTHFIDGSRGAGKSTFMQSVRAALKDDSELKFKLAFIAVIDPSRIEQSEIILLVILQRLGQSVEEALRATRSIEHEDLRSQWRKAFKGVAGGLSLFAQGYHPLNDLDPELFLEWGLERTGDSFSLREKLHYLFDTACKILGVSALMFGFDDADTDATHAINLLECIRKYLDTPRLMVLVTGDMELYSLLANQHFAKTVAGQRESAIKIARNAEYGDRSSQYLRMIDHLEEQYLLKLFPLHRRVQLRPLWNLARHNEACMATFSGWEGRKVSIIELTRSIVRYGLRIKSESDVALYTEFLLKQPLRSVLQVLANSAPHLQWAPSNQIIGDWSPNLTEALRSALQALALSSLYKLSVDTNALTSKELHALTKAVFDLSLQDGDIDTAPYLRPMSAKQDIKVGFTALAAEVPNLCALQPGVALRYLLRGPGSVSIFNLASSYLRDKESETHYSFSSQFESYMGIGRKEDGLDWSRRATAAIALPYSVNYKARVVLPGVIGLRKTTKDRNGELTARRVIQQAISDESIGRLPTYALSMITVVGGATNRTYASIFVLIGLIEKLLSSESLEEASAVFRRAYPSVTVSGPNWLKNSEVAAADEVDDGQTSNIDEDSIESSKQTELWESIKSWLENTKELYPRTTPSGIFLGKVWTRLFYSLHNAADELKSQEKFDTIMEIFALCVINSFLIEESEHHLVANLDSDININRNNPRKSASDFVKKIGSASLDRLQLPYTAIMATCPLLLGLLDSRQGYEDAFFNLFPKNTSKEDIKFLLCQKPLKDLMEQVSLTGESRTNRSRSGALRGKAGVAEKGQEDSE